MSAEQKAILDKIQTHFEDPYHRGECEAATHAADGRLHESGCAIMLELIVSADAQITEAWFEADGCETCEAIASLVVQWCEGKTIEDVRAIQPASLLEKFFGSSEVNLEPCGALPFELLKQATSSPVDFDEDSPYDLPGFGGPSLREEC